MLIPKKRKYRKAHRGRIKGIATRGSRISFGTFGLKAMTRGYLTSRQIEAARRAITRQVKRGGKIWIRVFPDKPYTKKAAEVPMGSGKGNVEMYRCPVLPGRVIMEMTGVTEEMAREAFRLAGHKLPMKTKFVSSLTQE